MRYGHVILRDDKYVGKRRVIVDGTRNGGTAIVYVREKQLRENSPETSTTRERYKMKNLLIRIPIFCQRSTSCIQGGCWGKTTKEPLIIPRCYPR